MSKSPTSPDDSPAPPEHSTVVLLLKTIGDTTWRMFVPIIGCLVLGIWLDKALVTYPWGVLAGIVIGILLTTILIRNQFKKL